MFLEYPKKIPDHSLFLFPCEHMASYEPNFEYIISFDKAAFTLRIVRFISLVTFYGKISVLSKFFYDLFKEKEYAKIKNDARLEYEENYRDKIACIFLRERLTFGSVGDCKITCVDFDARLIFAQSYANGKKYDIFSFRNSKHNLPPVTDPILAVSQVVFCGICGKNISSLGEQGYVCDSVNEKGRIIRENGHITKSESLLEKLEENAMNQLFVRNEYGARELLALYNQGPMALPTGSLWFCLAIDPDMMQSRGYYHRLPHTIIKAVSVEGIFDYDPRTLAYIMMLSNLNQYVQFNGWCGALDILNQFLKKYNDYKEPEEEATYEELIAPYEEPRKPVKRPRVQ